MNAPTTVINGDTTDQVDSNVIKFDSDKPREKMIPLEWPVTVNGVRYAEVRVRRVTGKEIREYVANSRAGKKLAPPVFDIPFEVYDALDADDADTLDEAGLDFLPRSVRDASEGFIPPTGESASD
ncbi:phage tail assembly protein [Brucella sp. TWI432]